MKKQGTERENEEGGVYLQGLKWYLGPVQYEVSKKKSEDDYDYRGGENISERFWHYVGATSFGR
jgi:hypothetical protein